MKLREKYPLKFKYLRYVGNWMNKFFTCRECRITSRFNVKNNIYKVRSGRLICRKCLSTLEETDITFAMGLESSGGST